MSEERIDEADSLYARKNWKDAARAYDQIVKASPSDARSWYRLGICYGSLSSWKKAESAYRNADELGVPPQFARYNLACVFARQSKADSAFAVLGRTVDAGFRGTQQLETDPDLAALRDDVRFAGIVDRARRNETPCAFAPESRQFDFWIGDWDVFDNTRNQARAGESHVEPILGQCVIFEHWKGVNGVSGKSFNAWNSQVGCWQQNWMDDGGTVTNYVDGHFADGKMVLYSIAPDGQQTLRLTFVPLDKDRVQQIGATSIDRGHVWIPTFHLNYVRKK